MLLTRLLLFQLSRTFHYYSRDCAAHHNRRRALLCDKILHQKEEAKKEAA